jgi:hypothetical protein
MARAASTSADSVAANPNTKANVQYAAKRLNKIKRFSTEALITLP